MIKLEEFKKNYCDSNYKNEKDILSKYYLFNIAQLKSLLSQSDYKAIKYMEGWFTEEEYLPIKEERQEYRNQINEYEELIKELEND